MNELIDKNMDRWCI